MVDSKGETARLDTDAARKAFARHNEKPVRCEILQSAGLGPAGARNRAIEVARGDFLALLDSDDLWKPEKLASQLAYLKKRPHLMGCQTREVWLKDGRELNQPARLRPGPGRFLKASFRYCLISPSAVLLSRYVFADLGRFDESFQVCEDFEFWLRYLSRFPMGLVDAPLTVKRSGEWAQQSASRPMLDELRIQAILQNLARARQGGPGEWRQDEIQAAFDVCLEKLAILEKGARKYEAPEKFAELRARVEFAFAATQNTVKQET